MEGAFNEQEVKGQFNTRNLIELLTNPSNTLEEAFRHSIEEIANSLKLSVSDLESFKIIDSMNFLKLATQECQTTIKNKLDTFLASNIKPRKIEESSVEETLKQSENELRPSSEPAPNSNSTNQSPDPLVPSPSPPALELNSSDIKPTETANSTDPVLPLLIPSSNVIPAAETIEQDDETFFEEESSQIVSNLFSRILEIFFKNGRSLQDLFEAIDVSKDGKVTSLEMRVELLKHDETITQEECDAVFEILDGNKDGSISLDELQKRIKLINEKAEAEALDPLAHMVFSKPLDPALTHGNLSVILLKVTNMKPGTHSVKIKVKDCLEYTTQDTVDTNPNYNFRCDFIFENRIMDQIPKNVDFELYNKGKIEGTGSFQWIKAMKTPNEFSLKVKTDAKTSTGQVRGTFFFSVKWTPIFVKVKSREEIEKKNILKVAAENHKRNLNKSAENEEIKANEESKANEEKLEGATENLYDFEAEGQLEHSESVINEPGEFFYVIETKTKVIERSITVGTRGKLGNRLSTPNRNTVIRISPLPANKNTAAKKK